MYEKEAECKNGLICATNCYDLDERNCDKKNKFGLNIKNTVDAQAYLIVCIRRRFDKMSKTQGLKKGFFQVLKKYYIQDLDINKMENSDFVEYFKTEVHNKQIIF